MTVFNAETIQTDLS